MRSLVIVHRAGRTPVLKILVKMAWSCDPKGTRRKGCQGPGGIAKVPVLPSASWLPFRAVGLWGQSGALAGEWE